MKMSTRPTEPAAVSRFNTIAERSDEHLKVFNKFCDWFVMCCFCVCGRTICALLFFGCGVSTVFIPIISHLVYEILYFDSNFFDRVAN